MSTLFSRAVLIAVLLCVVVACDAEDDDPSTNPSSSTTVQLQPSTPTGWLYGESVAGRGLMIERFGDSGPPILILNAIHGNERPAVLFGERARTLLQQSPQLYENSQVFLITAANPDGVVYGTRHNLSDVDLNRNFDAKNFQPSGTNGSFPLQEPESSALADLIEFLDPVAILSVHNPLDQMDYNGPAELLAKAMAKLSGIPFKPPIGGLPGSLGSWAGEDLQIPTITLELPPAVNSLAGFEPGWLATEYLLEKAADFATSSTGRIDLQKDTATNYAAWDLTSTPEGRVVRIERLGNASATTGGVLLIAAIDGSSPNTAFVAERIRAKIVQRVVPKGAKSVWIITLANPDGAVHLSPTSGDDVSLLDSFSPPYSGLAATLTTTVDQLQPDLVVYVRNSVLAGVAFAGPFPQKLSQSLQNQGLIERSPNLGGATFERYVTEVQEIPTLLLDVAPFVDTEADAEPYRKVSAKAVDQY